MEFIIIKLKLRQEKLAMDLFTYRDKISQPLTACKRNPESFLSGHRLHAKRYEQEPENPTSYLGEIGKI